MDQEKYLNEIEEAIGLFLIRCPQSSNIQAYAYDSITKKLWIIFTNDNIYAYENVPYQIADGLHLAESKGKYHSQHIKGNFEYNKYELQ